MSALTVVTPALAAASVQINSTAACAASARAAAVAAAGQSGAFGGEPIGAIFLDMCSRAQTAMSEIETTVQSLATNVGAAALGYLITDRGVIPEAKLPGHNLPGYRP